MRDHDRLERLKLAAGSKREEQEYWLEKLSGELYTGGFPTGPAVGLNIPGDTGDGDNEQSVAFTLEGRLFNGLMKLSTGSDVRLHIVLSSVLTLLLGKYTGSDDIILGMPILKSKTEGELLNTACCIRSSLDPNMTFKTLLMKVRQTVVEADKYRNYPLEVLARELGQESLFDTALLLENIHDPQYLQSTDPLVTFSFLRDDTSIRGQIRYKAALYDNEYIERLAGHFKNLLEKLLDNPENIYADIDVLSDEETHRLVVDLNQTEAQFPKDKTALQLFEEQAARLPDQPAVSEAGSDRVITYGELNARANRLALLLQDRGIGPDSIVGVMVDHSIALLIGIMGILKAGGAYLPINPSTPKGRIEYMLKDSNAQMVLTSDDITAAPPATRNPQPATGAARPNNLAYIIYTSGSTGRPKGVAVEHGQLVNFLYHMYNRYDGAVDSNDRCLSLTNMMFDVSVWEYFLPLCFGAQVVILEEEKRFDVAALSNAILDEKITLIYIPPGLLKDVQHELLAQRDRVRLDKLLVGVEPIRDEVLETFMQLTPGMTIINGYGPTETTICCTSFNYRSHEPTGEIVPIGVPLSNNKVLLLDVYGNLVPQGIPGELCVSGDGVSRGYLNNPELTAEKYVGLNRSHRTYKTGDLARWLPDGNLRFVGRRDQQLKIRGYRVELGEIESCLLKHNDIKEALVLAKTGGEIGKYLCAYVISDMELESNVLREYLLTDLPDYMIPSYFIQLDQIPLTANGKVDKNALPEPGLGLGTAVYAAPRNPVERKMVKIWSGVLGLEQQDIGIDDSFFELGGHSLKATMVTSKVHEVFDAKLELTDIFTNPTIRMLAAVIQSNVKDIFTSIGKAEAQDYYPLSSAQKRLYILQQMDTSGRGYNIPAVLLLEGKVQEERVASVFKALIRRHESLRTSFHMIDGQPVQVVSDTINFLIDEIGPIGPIEDIIAGFIRPFDLSRAPLFRVGLVEMETEKHLLMVDMHHIISDGTSLGIMVNEFMSLYEGKEIPGLRVQYKDYAVWLRRAKMEESLRQQEAFWLKEFEGEIPVLSLPYDYFRPALQSFAGKELMFEIAEDETRALNALAAGKRATLFMVLHSLYNVLLAKLSGQEDIVVGTPVAGRSHEDLQQIVGMFVNTLALRNFPVGEMTFREFLADNKRRTLAAFENRDYQYESLVNNLSVERDAGRNPLFDTMLIVQNISIPELEIPGLKLKPYAYERDTAKFDLTFECTESAGKLFCTFEYCTLLFKNETIARFTGYLRQLIVSVLEDPDKKIVEIDIIPEAEKEELLIHFNDTAVDYPKDKTIHQLFEEKTQIFGDRLSVNCGQRRITYGELDREAGQVAHQLQEKGVGPGAIVAIKVERSLEMVMGIFGILKSGAAYLPIDPDYPQERIDYMLKDSNAALLLTGDDLADAMTCAPTTPVHPLPPNPAQLAYIIYTSGSTGKPKGVLVEHRAVLNTLFAMDEIYPFGEEDVYLLKTAYTFDVSVAELFGWFFGGGALAVLEKGGEKDPAVILDAIETHGVTHINFVPSMFNVLVEILNAENTGKLAGLKYIFLAGEALLPNAVNRFRKFGTGVLLENIYGPTEASIYASMYSLSDWDSGPIPIGGPLPNIKLYILDAYDHVQPIGVAGELHISGAGLARGYLNKPELTAEKFVDLNRSYGSYRTYRTGDLVRWLPDGSIQFLGRIDQQVKIRGFRIEMGEIESQLVKREDVKEAVVIDRETEHGEKYLCAYIVPESQSAGPDELRNYLSGILPDYMVPAFFVKLEDIPVTPSGKVDRRALPAPQLSANTRTYNPPRDRLEETLVDIWAQVLGAEREVIGIDDNFFHLGGHSLKATIMASRLHRELGVKIKLADVFKTPTIRHLVSSLKDAEEETYTTIMPVEKQEYYPVSSAQKRLYILQQMEPHGTGYNLPTLLALEGKVDKETFENTFHRLVQRHESFRTSFHMVDGEPIQVVHDAVDFSVGEIGPTGPIEDIISNFIRPFDLAQAPILRAALIEEAEDRFVLVVDVHHIISDGTSQGNMVREFMALYDGDELPPIRVQYKDFSAWQNSRAEQEKLKQQEVYWLGEFSRSEIPVLALPTDFPRPTISNFSGSSVKFEIDERETEGLNHLASGQGTTLYMVLVTLYNIFLAKISGQEDITVGTPVAGRRHADLEPVIGMFINNLALMNAPVATKTAVEFLNEVKEKTLTAFDNQDYQYEDLVEKVAVSRDTGRNPLFDTMLILQNMDLPELVIPGLSSKPYPYEMNTAKFDLTLGCYEIGQTMACAFEYSTQLFKEETIKRFTGYLKQLISSVLDNPRQKIAEIEIISGEEKDRILSQFNETETVYPNDKTIHQLFEEQVVKCNNRCSLVSGRSQITYGELDRKTNALAAVLQEKGVGLETIVAIKTERSLEMVIGVLAILKAGGAYLPIDPQYPQDRIDYMLKDSNAALMLTSRDIAQGLAGAMNGAPTTPVRPNSLSYIIYTSGSTGKPKGVMVENSNVVRLVKNTNYVKLDKTTRVLQTGAPVFDATTFEIWGPLLNGGQLALASNDTILDPRLLEQSLARFDINTLWLSSPLFNQLMQHGGSMFSGLDYLLVGGDVLSPRVINRVRTENKGLTVINGYGPTENTTFSTTYTIDRDFEDMIPIGKPIANSTAYILDRNDMLQPIGIAGELYVGGDGVSRGYLNNPELTASRFVIGELCNDRLYRTGDLARWLPDGNIQFLGRIDQQVKIRGFRIELGEIESRLLERKDVKEALVLAREQQDGDKYLCAYIVAESEAADILELKNDLSRKLPEYMVPSFFVEIDEIPLTPNGKIDRNALPVPQTTAGAQTYIPPRNRLEKTLVEIWSEVLGMETEGIGIDDNFFELGGHSLKATTLVHRIYKDLEVKIGLQDVFTSPTVRELAQKARGGEKIEYELIAPAERKEYYELSYAQRRLWVLCQFEEDSTAYNIPLAVMLDGKLDEMVFSRAVQVLSDRHDSLRTVFRVIGGVPFQVILPHIDFALEIFDLRGMDPEEKEDKTRRIYRKYANWVFNLENGPLFLFKLVQLEEKRHMVICNIHHIVSDGWSQGNIYNEIVTFYNFFLKEDTGTPLPPLELQYPDYSQWHNRLIGKDRFQKSREYWLGKFSDKPNGIELPLDRPRKAIQTFNGGRIAFTLDNKMTTQLQALCLKGDATLFMGLLTLLNIFLYRFTGQTDIIIGSPIANRKQPELYPLVGFLVNTLVFRNNVDSLLSFAELLQTTKNETLSSYENQDFPFDLLVEGLELDRDMSQSPIFNVMLAHNNTETGDENLSMDGLSISPFAHSEDFNMSKFDLTFFADEADGQVSIRIEYNSDLFDRTTIERMTVNFLTLAADSIAHSGKPASSLNNLGEDERKIVLEAFNDTRESFTALTLQELFEQQVERYGERCSVVDGQQQISYGELNRRANRLARYLLGEYNVKPKDIIGISMDRGFDMIVAIWGIIKSGAGYLAVDPTYPRERVLHVLEDSRADLLIADRIRPELYGGYTGEIIEIPARWQEIEKQNPENPPAVNQPGDVLYVNYTSGSTGTPNGAMLSHDCLTNLIQWQNRETTIDCSLRVLQFTSINFCVSFQEIAGTLTSGGQLHLVGDVERQDTAYLMEFLSRHRIQVLFLPFSYLNFLFTQSSRWTGTFRHSLQHIITAGEQLKITSGFKQFLDDSPHLHVHNHYGSTEMHVVTSYTLDASTAGQTPIPPAGKPISNIKIFILDEYLNPVPMGVWGELTVVGDTEILGYINNKELTDEKLVHHPVFSKESNTRLYRSGDIGRWLPDGNIELRGRKDFMVKIRGFRIELGEVESKILSLPQVRECVVVPLEDDKSQKNLFAYVSAYKPGTETETGIDARGIKRAISSELPLYMIPEIIILDNLPLMPNGKVDRGKLPQPDFAALADRLIEPPSNDVEAKLVDIWSQLLETEKENIGIDDNFFDLGGHSLKATTMMSKIHKELDIKLDLVEIFKNPTIRDIAALVQAIQMTVIPDMDFSDDEEIEEMVL